jgi:hypothetical protein
MECSGENTGSWHRQFRLDLVAGRDWEDAEDHWRGISGRRTGACRDFSILFGWNLFGGLRTSLRTLRGATRFEMRVNRSSNTLF